MIGTPSHNRGLRMIATMGAVIGVAGLSLSAAAQELWHLYVTLVIASVGGGIFFPVSSLCLNAWTVERKGFMGALMSMGASFGAIFFGFTLRPIANSVGVR